MAGLLNQRMPANDITVVAQWTEVVAEVESEYVKIVFDRKKMTEEEVKEIVKNITQDENFYIVMRGLRQTKIQERP